MGTVALSRREFLLRGGALVLGFSIGSRLANSQDATQLAAVPANKLPGSLEKEDWLDSWIRIDSQGNVTVFTGKAEIGQGIKTALIQVAAEELYVAPARVAIVTADTERTADEGYTAGSRSMQESATAVRQAAAEVRQMLLGLAATKLGPGAGQMTIADGVIQGANGGKVSYGELVSAEALHIRATGAAQLKDPRTHTIVGKRLNRVDIPAKVTGGVAYVQDMRLSAMAHGRVVRPPGPGAHLRDVDITVAQKNPGTLQVVRNGSFLGVIAEREFQAIKAMNQLRAAAKWDEAAKLPDASALYQTIRGMRTEDQTILNKGTVSASGNSLEASYLRPYQMHASIGPSCAIAQLVDGNYTVWTHSQGVYPLREALAEMLSVPKEQVRCIHAEGSGCYGHNGADDVAADAVLLARALPGRPVRVQWMREDEHAWEPYGPAMMNTARAKLDASGRISEFQFEVWSNTHSSRPGKAGNLLAATHLQQPFTPPPPRPIPQPDGGGDRNAIPLYSLPNVRVVNHFIAEMPLRVSALRSLGAYANVFAIESFMDELAAVAKQGSVEFRLKHMEDPRALAVMRLAAERFNWNGYKRAPGRGRGFAFARYKNSAAYTAVAMEVQVGRENGIIRVPRVVAAVDSGEPVNHDGIRNQIEGGIIQSLSWSLAEEVTFDRSRVTSVDWGGYPILRFDGIPDIIEVHIVDNPGQPFLGTGEAAQGPACAALANGIADATRVRLRQLPFSRARVRAAMAV